MCNTSSAAALLGVVLLGCAQGGAAAIAASTDAGEAREVDAGEPTGDDAGPLTPDAGQNLAPEGVIDTPDPATTIQMGEALMFSAHCIDPEGSEVSHHWDFGGGAATVSLEDPGEVRFVTAGVFEVTYTCTDAEGRADPNPARVTVAVNAPGFARIFTPLADPVIEVGGTVVFNGTCAPPGGGPVTHAWDFGGGAPSSTDEDPGPIVFETAGIYLVTYSCSDQGGATSRAMVTVTVSARPQAQIDAPATGNVRVTPGASLVFEATCTDPDGDVGLTHTWDFAGGAPPSAQEDPGPIIFSTPGTFLVTYRCRDSAGLEATPLPTRTVHVVEPTRWVAFVGELTANGTEELGLVDISGAAPGPLRAPIAGAWPSTAAIPYPTNQTVYSPDGRYLAFLADATTDGSDDLYVIDLNTSAPSAINLTRLSGDRDVENFLWAPDSAKLAYIADVTTVGTNELHVVDLTGGLGAPATYRAHAPLTANAGVLPGSNESPYLFDDLAWSHDAQKVYFHGAVLGTQDEGFVFDLGSPSAGARRLHTPLSGSRNVEALYAMGNDIVLVVGDLETENARDIFAVDTSRGGALTPVRLSPRAATATQGMESAGYPMPSVAVSPDQSRVLFLGDYATANQVELWYADLRGGVAGASGIAIKAHPALAGANVDIREFRWSPRGDRFAYVDNTLAIFASLWLVDASGASLAAPLQVSPPPTTSPSDVRFWSWSPDGSGIAFELDPVADRRYELFYAALPSAATSVSPIRVHAPYTDYQTTLAWVTWLSGTELIYNAEQLEDDHQDLFVVDLNAPTAVPTHLNAPLPTGGTLGFYTLWGAATADGAHFVARGEWRTDGIVEAVLLDLDHPGGTVALHPPLPAGQSISYVVGSLF